MSFLLSSRVLGAALLMLGAAAGAQQAPSKELPKFQGDLQKYWNDACARCHGANGNGRDAKGSPLPDAGFDFTDARKANKKKDADWVKVTMEGKDKMPAFKDKMSAADAQKMVTDILRPFAAKH